MNQLTNHPARQLLPAFPVALDRDANNAKGRRYKGARNSAILVCLCLTSDTYGNTSK
jgi:hypothetical protein